jgi:hypothetical protein
MTTSDLHCQDERRRHQLRSPADQAPQLSGLDYVEVEPQHQQQLCIHFLGPMPAGLTPQHIRIEGGQRIRHIAIVDPPPIPDRDALFRDDCFLVHLAHPGDFSTYTLRLIQLDEDGNPRLDDRGQYVPFKGLDPRYASVEFSFKVSCPSDLDCKSPPVCEPPPRQEPDINYLAKDYASFRQLMLDRLSLIMPEWQERLVPDLGITLVELLAYMGDYLSYYQDAVATEAYLGTARQRISVRRHGRLVDYALHEGCNARTWIWLETDQEIEHINPLNISFITTYPGAPATGTLLEQDADLDARLISPDRYITFEPAQSHPMHLHPALNTLFFYTWGDRQCCLPKGSTQATLSSPELKSLISIDDTYDLDLMSIRRPEDLPAEGTGLVVVAKVGDAYHARIFNNAGDIALNQGPDGGFPDATLIEELESALTQPSIDGQVKSELIRKITASLGYPLQDLPLWLQKQYANGQLFLLFQEVKGATTGEPGDADLHHRHVVRVTHLTLTTDPLTDTPILQVEWTEADALPFPLCISGLSPAPNCALIENISVVHGNVLLADQGCTVTEDLGIVDEADTVTHCLAENLPAEGVPTPVVFRPHLQQAPLTFRQAPPAGIPASRMLAQDPRQALPQLTLHSTSLSFNLRSPQDTPPETWTPVADLLSSGRRDRHLVVEMDHEGTAHLRFGDNALGKQPAVGTHFAAKYRVGNGAMGNVGADTLVHVVLKTNGEQSQSIPRNARLIPHNPLPAVGGTAPEPITEAKYFAPGAFRTQLQRAIVPQDYADIVMRDFPDQVQRAAAAQRWNGSWAEILVAVDPKGTEANVPGLAETISQHLRQYRRMGHDVVVQQAVYVPLLISMTICVQPDYLRGHVKAALLDVFSTRRLGPDRLGVFHPDQLTFGEGIHVSYLAAQAQTVTGVRSVTITQLERLGNGSNQELEEGTLPLSPMEIAQLDNDPNYPERGQFHLTMEGGR